MTILILERVPTGLRGELSKWMIEVKAGVFVGSTSSLVRDKLWDIVSEKVKDGASLLLYNSDSEQGFVFRVLGLGSRNHVDLEGISLMRIPK
jgi:CRISPR-associated protein Cas2